MLHLKHIGGSDVERGTYWNLSTGERITIEGRGILPGGKGATYYKAAPVAILAAGPFLGLLYAAFLPFIGIAMLVKLVSARALGGAVDTAARGASFGWRPVEAYLTGKRGGKTGKENKDKDNKTS